MSERMVFVVLGRLGEYSDAREWCVRAFVDRVRAETFAEAAREHIAALAADGGFDERVYWDETPTEADIDALAKFDPTLVYTIEHGPRAGQRVPGPYRYAGETPEYVVVECPLETDGADNA